MGTSTESSSTSVSPTSTTATTTQMLSPDIWFLADNLCAESPSPQSPSRFEVNVNEIFSEYVTVCIDHEDDRRVYDSGKKLAVTAQGLENNFFDMFNGDALAVGALIGHKIMSTIPHLCDTVSRLE